MIGKSFGRLTVRAAAPPIGGKRKAWGCECVCGKSLAVRQDHLKSGNTRSCGCGIADAATTHGMSGTKEFRSWVWVKSRVFSQTHADYPRYGGAGIGMCPHLADSFHAFLQEIGPCPNSKFTVERIDNTRGYEKGNIKWASRADQARNRSSTRISEKVACEIPSMVARSSQAEVARSLGVHPSTISLICAGKIWQKEI